MHSLHKESQYVLQFQLGSVTLSRGHSSSRLKAAGTAVAPLKYSEPTVSKTRSDQNIKHKAQKRTKWEKMWHPPFLTTTFVPSTMCSHQPHTDPGLQGHILPTSNRLKYQFSLLLHFQAHSATAGARGETLSRQKAKRSSKIKKEKYKPALRAKREQRPSPSWCLGFLLPSEMFEMCLRTSTTVTGYCSS